MWSTVARSGALWHTGDATSWRGSSQGARPTAPTLEGRELPSVRLGTPHTPCKPAAAGHQARTMLPALVVFLAVWFGFELWHLHVQPFWLDETYGLTFAERPFPDLFQGLASYEPQLPPYYLELRLWEALAGPSTFAQRWPMVACLILTGVVLVQLGRQLGGMRASWLALALWAVQPEGFWYAQEARMYAPLILLATVTVWALLHCLQQPASRVRWLVFASAELLTVWTHYAGVLVPATALLALVLFVPRRWWITGTVAIVAPVVTLAPWLWYIRHIAPATAKPSGTIALQVWTALRALQFGFGGPLIAPVFVTAVLALVAIVTILAVASRRWQLQFAALAAWAPIILTLLVPALHVLFSERYLCFTAPMFSLLIAVTAAWLWQRLLIPAAALTLATLLASAAGLVAVLTPTFHQWYDYPAALAFVRAHEQAGQLLVNDSGDDPTAMYYYTRIDGGTLPVFQILPFRPGDVTTTEKTALQLSQHYTAIWLPLDANGTWDGARVAQRAFSATLLPTQTYTFRDVTLLQYLTAQGLAQRHSFATAPTFGGAITLTSFGTGTFGAHTFVSLAWHTLAAPVKSYTVFVHLTGLNGALAGQADAPPDSNRQPTTTWEPGSTVYDLHQLPDLAPWNGVRLSVGLYDPVSGTRVPLAGSASGELQLGDMQALLQAR